MKSPGCSTLSDAELQKLALGPPYYQSGQYAHYSVSGQLPAASVVLENLTDATPTIKVESHSATATYTTPLGKSILCRS